MLPDRPDNLGDFLRDIPPWWEEISSPVFEDMKELSRSRLVIDNCNIGIKVGDGGVVNFYRNKYCDIPTPLPQPEPEEDYTEIPAIPPGNSTIYFAVPKRLYTYEQGSTRNTTPQTWAENNTFFNILEIQYPYTGSYRIPSAIYPNVFYTPEFYIRYERRRFQSMNGVYFQAFWSGSFPYQDIENMRRDGWSIENSEGIFHPNSTYTITIIEPFEYYAIGNETVINNLLYIRRSRTAIEALVNNPNSSIKNRIQTTRSSLSYGAYASAPFSLPIPGRYPGQINLTYQGTDIYGNYYSGTASNLRVQRGESRWEILAGAYTPNKKPDPPPPPEFKRMDCCTNLEQLLKLILKKIGSEHLPATVPNSLAKKNSGTKQIGSLAEFISYHIKQMDAVTGKFPIEIKIKDADLTQEGDQEKFVRIPNLAEGLIEIIGILLILQSESNANLIATISGMIEAGSAKQSAIIGADYAKANSEYLGYKGKQVEREVPFAFKPGEPRLDKMLVAGNYKVKTFENDDKEDLNDTLAPVLELAAMWKAQNFRNLGTSNTLDNLKKILSGAFDLTEEIDKLVNKPPTPDPNNPDAPPPEPKKSDWDAFVEEAEQGFIGQAGITDNVNPYGRKFEQRPRIREIGKTSDEETT